MTMTKDILDWCEKYLEPKNKHLGNVPVCPYARAARLQNKYKILEAHNWDSFIDEIIKGVEIAKTPDVQIVIVACNDIRMEPEELAAITHAYNIVFVPQDIYLMCFHPEDEEEDEEVEYLDSGDWTRENECMMGLIQRFDEGERGGGNVGNDGKCESRREE